MRIVEELRRSGIALGMPSRAVRIERREAGGISVIGTSSLIKVEELYRSLRAEGSLEAARRLQQRIRAEMAGVEGKSGLEILDEISRYVSTILPDLLGMIGPIVTGDLAYSWLHRKSREWLGMSGAEFIQGLDGESLRFWLRSRLLALSQDAASAGILLSHEFSSALVSPI
jgi:hypothetical protein